MYLVDTNIWLERLLDQGRSVDVGAFLAKTPSDMLFCTDFCYHSIGVILCRLHFPDLFLAFTRDLFSDGGVRLVRLGPDDMDGVVRTMKVYALDFDDAYQYCAAKKNGLSLVSFDADFDRTPEGRMEPDIDGVARNV
jgi:predicted nucleic acid-binding protein